MEMKFIVFLIKANKDFDLNKKKLRTQCLKECPNQKNFFI